MTGKTFWCLYRENPFTVYFEGHGFQPPRRDETRKLKSFESQDKAWEMVRVLHIRTFVEKRSKLNARMKHDYSR